MRQELAESIPVNPVDRGNDASDTFPLLDRRQASKFLTERGYKTAERTLAKLASVGGGPSFRHFGRRVLYDPGALLQWALGRLSSPRSSTSDSPRNARRA